MSGNTFDATFEPSEPVVQGIDTHTVWYSYTSSATPPLSIVIDTTGCGTDFDTIIEVYTGASLIALTAVVDNDDCTSTTSSSCVTVTLTASTTYYIRVYGVDDGQNGWAFGNLELRWNTSTCATHEDAAPLCFVDTDR